MILKDREAGQYDVSIEPAKVQSRLAYEIDPEGLLFDSGHKSFVGVVGNGSFRLHVRGLGTNSFQPNLYGTPQIRNGSSSFSLLPVCSWAESPWGGSATISAVTRNGCSSPSPIISGAEEA
jgi:hypothetical protein